MQLNMVGATNNIICGGLGIIKCKYVTDTGLDFNANAIEQVAHGFVFDPRDRILDWRVCLISSGVLNYRWLPIIRDAVDPGLVIAWSDRMTLNHIYIERRTGSPLQTDVQWSDTEARILIWYRSSIV